ncbi:TMV resistance protein N-like [Neltuma alba]|uniref:TMV resistance protein N-like n=1 Tax=Neltuma alba TaxID=207710 RepID=UPI0010A451BB|nr:TMV resistance protein N-like [Prosopis alba]
MDEGKNTLGYLLRNRKVMLILDDVNHKSQLENLAGRRVWFGDGSRIIITTRDVQLLTSHEVDEIYEVQPMDNDESFQLFCQKAFRGRGIPNEQQFEGLALSAIHYPRGLPLALCVLGSFFCGKDSLTEWGYALQVLRQDSNDDIFKKLRISYYELNYIEKTLKGKSLLAEIEIGNTTYIEMRDLVQDIGRLIVNEEFPVDVGRSNRLWIPFDIDRLLERDMLRN